MFDEGDASGVPAGVIEAFAHLGGLDVDACDTARVDAGLSSVHRIRSWVAAREAALSRRADALRDNSDNSDDGSGPDAEERLRHSSGSSRRRATRRARRGRTLGEAPLFEDALADGEITAEHVDALTAALADLDAETKRGVLDGEADLVDSAIAMGPDQFRTHLQRRIDRISEAQGIERFARQHSARKASLFVSPDSGMHILSAQFDPIAGARLAAVLSSHTEALWRQEHGDEPTRQSSTPKQRMADAVEALICGTVTDDTGETTPATRNTSVETTVLVIADHDSLEGRLGDARLADGTPIPVDQLLRLACDANILPAVFDTTGQPLWLGRTTRLASQAQRAAVIARDGGCIGCGARPDWCQVHHIDWWQNGGTTDIDNLCLLCSNHHHLVHDQGWTITRTPDGNHTINPPP